MGFVIGLKIVCTVSTLSSLILLIGTIWTFCTRLSSSINRDFQHHGFESDIFRKDPNFDEFEKVKEELKQMYKKTRPVLLTCSVIAFLAGVVQLIVSVNGLFPFPCMTNKLRIKIWLSSHLTIFVILVICLLVPSVGRLNVDRNNHSWIDKVKILNSVIKGTTDSRMKSDFLYEYFETSSVVYYSTVGFDCVATVVLFFGLILLMRNKDYVYS